MKYTKEDLMNTWGVVESKEHAEYIVEVAGLHGFEVGIDPRKAMCFEFSVDSVNFYEIPSDVFAYNEESKQITIPLPPKDKAEKPDFSKPPKHFDCVCNKCGGKCCIGNCDEWPKVGGEALTISDRIVDVLAVNGGVAWVKYRGDAEHYATLLISDLKKPKSKQDLLIEELHQKLLANNCSDEYLLACDIVQGKIEGLSYE